LFHGRADDHARLGKWLSCHGTAFQNTLQQTGPRSYDKVFPNWFMPMVQRQIGGPAHARTMLSLSRQS
jgi:hypothetical protein